MPTISFYLSNKRLNVVNLALQMIGGEGDDPIAQICEEWTIMQNQKFGKQNQTNLQVDYRNEIVQLNREYYHKYLGGPLIVKKILTDTLVECEDSNGYVSVLKKKNLSEAV